MDRDGSANDASSASGDGTNPFAPGDASPGVAIPDHRLLRCIGRGSYGSVWLAQNMMGMYRAVKVVHRHSFEDRRPFERELSGILKFEPISRSHEGFVDVLHVGIRDRDYLYYVMELGDDETAGQSILPAQYSPNTLARKINAEGRLSFEKCLRLGLAMSDALAELHKHDLVHRDIKPANIIYINGAPKLADIGLVASTAEARSYVGTEGFIPPEGPGTATADIYSLGKVLYEASTGKDRHQFPELPTLLYEDPESARFLELNEIILRACHQDPRRRYQSAAEMHSDLVVLANGQSVKRLRLLERRFAWLKKIASISLLAFAAGAVILYLVYHAYIETRRRQIEAYVALGTRNVQAGDYLRALPYFAEATRLDGSGRKQTDDRLRFASTLSQCPRLIQIWHRLGGVNHIDFDSTGERILIVESARAAQVFDVKSGKPVSPQIGENADTSIDAFVATLSPDGTWIATANGAAQVEIWTLHGTHVKTLVHSDRVMNVSTSPDGKLLAAACIDGSAWIWNVEDGAHLFSLLTHGPTPDTTPLNAAIFSHNGKLIATAGRDGTARIWDVATGRQLGKSAQHPTWVSSIAFSPDDRFVATGCFDHKAHVWDVKTCNEIFPPLFHDDAVWGEQFSPDGRFILTAGSDSTARIWVESTHQPFEINPILQHGDRVLSVAVAPNGHQIATACADGTVRVWELAGGQVAAIPKHGSFSDDGERFITSDSDAIQVCDVLTGQPVSEKLEIEFPSPDLKLNFDGAYLLATSTSSNASSQCQLAQVFEVATGRPIGPKFELPDRFQTLLSRDAKTVLTVSSNSMRAWNTESGSPVSPSIPVPADASAVLSPDASRIALMSDKSVRLFDLTTGRECFPSITLSIQAYAVVFSPDGSRFVTCPRDLHLSKCSAQIWDAATGRPIGTPLQHRDGVLCAAFSPDGRKVVTGSEDYDLIVWDAQTGKQLLPPAKHAHHVVSVNFSPDGRWIVSSSLDKTARIWSAETGEPLTPPLRHPTPVYAAQFLPDGKHIVTRGPNDETWLWNVPVDERPVADLRDLATMLSGRDAALPSTIGTFQSDAPEVLWERLRQVYPGEFSASQEQILAWDEYLAQTCETERDCFGAEFHLERLLLRKPGDQSLIARLERVKRAAEADLSPKVSP